MAARVDIYGGAIAIRKTREEEKTLPIYDTTRLVAVNTCPRWAALRYGHNKIVGVPGRAMALEAGTACHHAFGALRLLQLVIHGKPDHAYHHAQRLFKRDGAADEFIACLKWDQLDELDHAREIMLLGLEYARFVDDPNDKKRTKVNIEEALLKYAQRYNLRRNRIWLANDDDPTQAVGIEVPFDYIFEFKHRTDETQNIKARYVGRLDGLVVDLNGNVVLEENKTTSQINSAWIANFNMSHQVTGYMTAAQIMTQEPVKEAVVLGLALPQPKTSPYGGFIQEPVTRNMSQTIQWMQWFCNSVRDFDEATARPLDATCYTHSCTRYFRECMFIPLCSSDRADQVEMFENELNESPWNPLDEDTGEA